MKSRLWLVAIVVAIVVGGLYWWVNRPADEGLTIVIIPSEDAVSATEKFKPFAARLEESLGMNVELLTVSDYAAAVEAMKYGHADIGRLGAFSYVMATEEADVEAVLVGIKEKTGRSSYNGLIIARPGLEDLNGATFAYVDPGSTSGYLVPNTYIKREGIELGEVLFAGSHPAVIEAVKNGSVDAGAIADNRWFYALEEGVIEEGQIEIFWESDPIPSSAWAVPVDMDEELRAAFVKAMLDMPREIAQSTGLKEIGYTVTSDSEYDFVREIAENADE